MVTLFYTKIHNEFFIFLGVALHYTIYHWIKFIQTLKNSGMSLNDIIEYINLAKYGNNTYQERKNLLIKSKQILLEKMSNLQSMIEKANYQINNYDNILVPKTDALIF